jgi:hypothetical protein
MLSRKSAQFVILLWDIFSQNLLYCITGDGLSMQTPLGFKSLSFHSSEIREGKRNIHSEEERKDETLQFKIPILREEGERERERVSLLSRYDKT